MMEFLSILWAQHKFLLALSLVAPIVVGAQSCYTLWDKIESDRQLNKIESNTDLLPRMNAMLEELRATARATVQSQTPTLRAYDNPNPAERDRTLSEVIAQYDRLAQAATLNPDVQKRESGEAAIEILRLLRDLPGFRVEPRLPRQPLILSREKNVFRVIFNVPMRATPTIAFQNLPAGVTPIVTEASKIGFTVQFSPETVPIGRFEYTADAEL